MVYFIIGLLTMWLMEDVLFQTLIHKYELTKELSEEIDRCLNSPTSDKLIVYSLYWPALLPQLIHVTLALW